MPEVGGISPASAQTWRLAGTFLDHGPHRIFVRAGGPSDKPPLLLIHGFPTSSLDWVGTWSMLERDYRPIAFDNLGFGFSSKPRRHRYSIHEQADIAERVVAEFVPDGRVHILAHDYGVSIAQELLARTRDGGQPVTALSCVFLNGGLLPEQHRARRIQKLLAGPFGSVLTHLLTKKSFARSFRAVFGPDTQPSDAEIDGFWATMSHGGGNRIQHKLLHYIADRRAHGARWRAVLSDPPCPVALINGPCDPVSGAHLADAIRVLNPDIPVVSLPGIGHYPQTEAPEAVAHAYARLRGGFGC